MLNDKVKQSMDKNHADSVTFKVRPRLSETPLLNTINRVASDDPVYKKTIEVTNYDKTDYLTVFSNKGLTSKKVVKQLKLEFASLVNSGAYSKCSELDLLDELYKKLEENCFIGRKWNEGFTGIISQVPDNHIIDKDYQYLNKGDLAFVYDRMGKNVTSFAPLSFYFPSFKGIDMQHTLGLHLAHEEKVGYTTNIIFVKNVKETLELVEFLPFTKLLLSEQDNKKFSILWWGALLINKKHNLYMMKNVLV